MVFSFRDSSTAASFPSSTSSPLHTIPVSSIFNTSSDPVRWLYTTAAIVAALLIVEQSVWRYKKRHLPGDSWTIPIIGRFADSLNPTLENYMKQWASGALSAVSVFNM